MSRVVGVIGVLVVSAGIIASSSFTTDTEVTLSPGEAVDVGDYTVRLDDIWGRDEPRRFTVAASLGILKGGDQIGTLEPKLNYYQMSDQPISTPAVRSRFHEDLYINLMAFERDGSSATIRVMIEPLVAWIWFGGMLVAVGALVALRYRSRRADDVVARDHGGASAREREEVAA